MLGNHPSLIWQGNFCTKKYRLTYHCGLYYRYNTLSQSRPLSIMYPSRLVFPVLGSYNVGRSPRWSEFSFSIKAPYTNFLLLWLLSHNPSGYLRSFWDTKYAFTIVSIVSKQFLLCKPANVRLSVSAFSPFDAIVIYKSSTWYYRTDIYSK
jgi:hypothetical protein